MLSVPKAKVVRGFSFFGVSFVYVIFEDGTDIYWARSRVLEYLSAASRSLPAGVTPTLGPGRDRRRLGLPIRRHGGAPYPGRAAHDRRTGKSALPLAKAEGVAEVASVGGFVRQYQVVVDPRRLKAFDFSLEQVRDGSPRIATWTSAGGCSSSPKPSSWCADAAT